MTWWVASLAEKLNAFAVATWLNFNLKNAKKVRVSLRALSKSQNWPAGPWPHQSFWHSNELFQRVFAKKNHLCAYHLGFNICGWIVLLKSEIPFTMEKVWPVSSDK